MIGADGFWSRLYYREGLIRDFDPAGVPSLAGVFPSFMEPDYQLLTAEHIFRDYQFSTDNKIALPPLLK